MGKCVYCGQKGDIYSHCHYCGAPMPDMAVTLEKEIRRVALGEELSVAVPFLNVRSGPSTSHRVVRMVKLGDILKIDKKNGGWVRINNGEWVSERYLDIRP